MCNVLVHLGRGAAHGDFGVERQVPDFDIAAAVDGGEDAGAARGPTGGVYDVFAGKVEERVDGLLGAGADGCEVEVVGEVGR